MSQEQRFARKHSDGDEDSSREPPATTKDTVGPRAKWIIISAIIFFGIVTMGSLGGSYWYWTHTPLGTSDISILSAVRETISDDAKSVLEFVRRKSAANEIDPFSGSYNIGDSEM